MKKAVSKATSYQRAIILLAGRSGVGKSGLVNALSGGHFALTDSTHGQVQYCICRQDAHTVREICLVDIAGQPHYRLTHQIYVQSPSVALLLFDPIDETDPLSGVHAWARFLSLVLQQDDSQRSTRSLFLVAARIDRRGARMSQPRIDEIVRELGCNGYFETSSKEGRGIQGLRSTLESSIDWGSVPEVPATNMFWVVKDRCALQRKQGKVFLSEDELFADVCQSVSSAKEAFVQCLNALDMSGVIRRLPQGLLLQPEQLSAYAAWLTMWVEDNGTGSIEVGRILDGDLSIPSGERIKDREQERIVLRTVLNDLLAHDVALYEQNGCSPLVIFPSLACQDYGSLDHLTPFVTVTFRGAVRELYTAITVRLARSDIFRKEHFGQNQDGRIAVYSEADTDGLCGMLLIGKSEDCAEVTILCNENVSLEGRVSFEEYVLAILTRMSVPGSVQFDRIFTCVCGLIIPEYTLRIRRERGFDFVRCSVCEMTWPLPNAPFSSGYERVATIDRAVEARREWEMSRCFIRS